MSRLETLENLKSHPMLGKLFKKLNKAEYTELVEFISERETLSNDQYASDVNRWYLGKTAPKHFNDMWALALQCNPFKPKERRA